MDEILTEQIPRSVWWGWGDPDRARSIDPTLLAYVRKRLQIDQVLPERFPPPIAEAAVQKSRLTSESRKELTQLLGDQNVHCGDEQRIIHAGGKSYKDEYRLFSADAKHAPDAVVCPKDEAQIQKIFQICEKYHIAVVPFGGGTSVVEGLEHLRGKNQAVISVDMKHFNKLTRLDKISHLATLGAGMRGPEVERALQKHGFTLGHYPQSHQEATVGGYAATRSSGQSSSGNGRFDELVRSLRVVTPRGVIELETQVPASAAGPKMSELFVGSEGIFGIITQVTVKVIPLPTHKLYAAWAFRNWKQATAAFRKLSQELGHGVMPTVCRLSDVPETADTLRLAGKTGARLATGLAKLGYEKPCLAIFMWAGTKPGLMRRHKLAASRILVSHGSIPLPGTIAKKWEKGRFHGPYLRDTLMRYGILSDTLETAANWSNLQKTYRAVQSAIAGAAQKHGLQAIVHCHISHLYPTGASLYYTFVMPQSPDPVALWQDVKKASLDAIRAQNVTVTHHHGVGAAHAPWVEPEHGGNLGTQVLRAVKNTLDPAQIMNPEKTLAPPVGNKKSQG